MRLTRPARPIVHIGYHKTATTWFQDHVWPAATSHDFVPRHAAQRALLSAPGMHFDAAAAEATLGLAARGRPVVLSEENLSGYPHNGGLHGLIAPEMARRIRAVLPDAQVVVFVRNQRDIVRATYAQYVAGGGTWSLRRYLSGKAGKHGALTRPYKAPAFEWEHFEFDRLIAHYDTLFGRDNVHVYPYEWLADADALLLRLRRDLGVALPAGLAQRRRANRSLGALGLIVLRLFNLFTRQSVVNKSYWVDLPGGQGLRHAAKWLLKRLPTRALALPADLAGRIDSHYASSNARLAAMRDLPFDALGYPLALALAPAVAPEPEAREARTAA